MDRLAFKNLLDWRKSPFRKPLLLSGARQVGKTHIVRKLGEQFENLTKVNFEKNPELAKIFESDLDPCKVIRELSLALNQPMNQAKHYFFWMKSKQYPAR